MDLSSAFGEVVKARRQGRGWSQAQLAEAAGLHHNYVSLVERGRTWPALDTLQSLAAAFQCELSELIAEAEAQLRAVPANQRAVERKG